MRLNTLLLGFAFLSLGQVQAAETQNLLQIYQQALAHDPAWASAQSDHLATKEKLSQGRSQFLPIVVLNAGSSVSQTNFKPIGGAIFGSTKAEFYSYGYDLNLVQPLYHKQFFAQLAQAKSYVIQSDRQLELVRQGLILKVARLYFDILSAQDRVVLIESQKVSITRQMEQAKANFDIGTSTITDFNEAKARFDLIDAQEVAANSDLEIKKRSLQSVIGSLPSSIVSVRDDLATSFPEPREMEAWVHFADENSLTVKIKENNLEVASQEIENQNSGHFPLLDIVGDLKSNHSSDGINGYGSDVQNATIGLQLQIPLYQGGYVTSKVQEAVAKKQKAIDELDLAKRQADLDTRSAYLNLVSSLAQIKAYEQALSSSQSQLDSTNLGYEVGVRTSVDVLNAQQQYFSAKRDLLQSRYTYLLNALSLKSAVGLLADVDLESVNQQLVSH